MCASEKNLERENAHLSTRLDARVRRRIVVDMFEEEMREDGRTNGYSILLSSEALNRFDFFLLCSGHPLYNIFCDLMRVEIWPVLWTVYNCGLSIESGRRIIYVIYV